MAAFSSPRFRRFSLYFLVAGALGTAVWYFGFRPKAQKDNYPRPAWAGEGYPWRVPVRTVAAALEDLPIELKAIGTVTPLNTVTVKSRVDGELLRVLFEDGQRVEKGDLLAEIDPSSYRIALARATAQLKQSEARLKSAQSDLARITELHDRKLTSSQELEQQLALVAEREGAVAADKAQVDDAQLKLDYTRLDAPISGRTGLRQVDAGNLVSASDTDGVVVIMQTRPISVLFTIPELELTAVREAMRQGQALSVEAWNRTETVRIASGVLKTMDNAIDTATGTVRLKAEFANDDERLFPRQFVNVKMHVSTLKNAVTIPGAAVQFGARGTYVYVVDKDNHANVRDIILGPVNGTKQSVAKGLKEGEAVVLEGLDRLRDGLTVVVTNDSAVTATP
ncbi:MAG TPA: MdtA/MuxA family multidrug efflux RND transporter periplasmic adaptor subunit [Opitutaceae bacterium]|nr:MdtA/MuxA family multidrug efflux RND transporter periplasmic adaptor subunit [Opitutaceae bacterium]